MTQAEFEALRATIAAMLAVFRKELEEATGVSSIMLVMEHPERELPIVAMTERSPEAKCAACVLEGAAKIIHAVGEAKGAPSAEELVASLTRAGRAFTDGLLHEIEQQLYNGEIEEKDRADAEALVKALREGSSRAVQSSLVSKNKLH